MEGVMEQVDIKELVQLCAVDGNLYARTFFPKTARQKSPAFHRQMDELLEPPENRFVAFSIFRDGAKTTKLRLFCSKRIAYGISHTILFVGKSQDHAKRSVGWLMKQVMFNRLWAQTFQLRPGSKWTTEECEIYHGTDDYPIRVLAVGITGSIRGINIDDYRPDLIILDDPCDEENTATAEARQKMEELIDGGLAKSLAPASEAPDAMMCLAQTPLAIGDFLDKKINDPAWVHLRVGCFDEKGESTWPDRYPTKLLLKEKEQHIQRNQLSLWMREKEAKIISRELAAFNIEHLQEYVVEPEGGLVYIGIDPTPPPKDNNAIKVINKKLDDAVILVIKLYKGCVYLLDYYITKSPDPGEFMNQFFLMGYAHHPFMVGIETVMNQRTLKWELEREMGQRKAYFTIVPVEDKRPKPVRILQTISRYASQRKIYVKKEHTAFKEQFGSYQPGVSNQKDDILDAFTIALDLINPALEGIVLEGEYEMLTNEDDIPALEDWRSAP